MAAVLHSCRTISLAAWRENPHQAHVWFVAAHRGTVYLSLREHYEKDGKMLPGGAGAEVGWAEGHEQSEGAGAVYSNMRGASRRAHD